MISRSGDSATARAVSMTRRTSSLLISRVRVGIGVTPLAVEAPDVRAGKSDVNGLDFAAGHGFGFADALLDRFDGGFEIDDRAFLKAFGFGDAESDRLQAGFARRPRSACTTFVEPMSRPTMFFSLRPIPSFRRLRHLSS